jgi:hypothetical protein
MGQIAMKRKSKKNNDFRAGLGNHYFKPPIPPDNDFVGSDYWSSTELSGSYAWIQDLQSGLHNS